MTDVHSPAVRSFNMSRIRGKSTKPELALRSAMHSAGLRFRLHRRDLPGTPDIIMPRSKIAVFVHGCYWHRHSDCKFAATPKSNPSFWADKFRRTLERDHENIQSLEMAGWTVIVAWECDISRSAPDVAERIRLAAQAHAP